MPSVRANGSIGAGELDEPYDHCGTASGPRPRGAYRPSSAYQPALRKSRQLRAKSETLIHRSRRLRHELRRLAERENAPAALRPAA